MDWGQSVYDAAIAAGASSEEAGALQQAALAGVAGMLDPNAELTQWLNGYIYRLAIIPRAIDTILNVSTRADGMAQAVINSAGGWILGARAEGGPVSGGMPYLVGEEGPEIFVPTGSGMIVPNGAMAASSRGGGAQTIVIPVSVGGRQVAEVVASELNRPGGPKITQKAITN